MVTFAGNVEGMSGVNSRTFSFPRKIFARYQFRPALRLPGTAYAVLYAAAVAGSHHEAEANMEAGSIKSACAHIQGS
jgi:hypothetical protein